MFYEDVMNYIKISDLLQKSILNNIESNIEFINTNIENKNINNTKVNEISNKIIMIKNRISDFEIQLWCKMYEEACRIYKLYIKIPTAPLEINISTTVRQDIYQTFHFPNDKSYKNSHKDSNKTHNRSAKKNTEKIPIFPDISNLNLAEALIIVQSYSLAFDSALSLIIGAIERDIFPRFKEHKAFATAVNEYVESMNV